MACLRAQCLERMEGSRKLISDEKHTAIDRNTILHNYLADNRRAVDGYIAYLVVTFQNNIVAR